MTADIADVVGQGVRRTVARNGLVFVGIVYALGVATGLFGASRPDGGAVRPTGFSGGAPAVAFPEPVVAVPPVVAALIAFVSTLVTLVVAIGAIRTFLSDERDRLPADAFTRRPGPTFLNVFLGGIAFVVAVAVGFVLFVVPGIFLLATLGFWIVFVVAEDENFVDGFRRSWDLTGGHRLRLSLVVLVVLVVGLPVSFFFAIVGIGLGNVSALLGVLVGEAGRAFVTVFAWATLAAAYDQVREAESDEADGDDEWRF